MRFGIKRFLIVVAILALGTRILTNYVANKTTYLVNAHIEIADWNPNQFGLEELLHRFQIPMQEDIVYISTTIDGVTISPCLKGAHFQSQGTYWDYAEKVKVVRQQMDAFVARNLDLEFENGQLRVIALEKGQSHHYPDSVVVDQTFDLHSPLN